MTPYIFDLAPGLAGRVHILPESSAPSLLPPAALQCLDHSPLIHLIGYNPSQAEHPSQALRNDGYRVPGVAESAAFRTASVGVVAERPAAAGMDSVNPEHSTVDERLAERKPGQVRCPPVVCSSVCDDLPVWLERMHQAECSFMQPSTSCSTVRRTKHEHGIPEH